MAAALTILPWSDPLLDTIGHDPRSSYAETFWLPVLGPTALLLLRHLATRFDDSPRGVELQVAEASRALGVGDRDGSSSPIVRTLASSSSSWPAPTRTHRRSRSVGISPRSTVAICTDSLSRSGLLMSSGPKPDSPTPPS
jgi:hypothetical protein